MLFAKRNLKNALFGFRSKPASEPEPLKPVAQEERNALLGGTTQPEPKDTTNMRNQTAAVHGPAQRLMGTLDQFNKFVIEARRKATSNGRWTDACMNELIHGVEIAIAEGWTDVVEALTDAGRVLQTYEDARQPDDALPFLAESHEILVLMAGDLLIGPVRSGVMRKWRNHYQRVVAEIENAGIELARDDDDDHAAAPPRRPTSISDDAFVDNFPFDAPTLTPLRPGREDDSLPTLDELLPLGEPISVNDADRYEATESEEIESSAPAPFDDQRITPFPSKTEPVYESNAEELAKATKRSTRKRANAGGMQASFFDDFVETEPASEDDSPVAATPDVIHLPQEKPVTSSEVVTTLDSLCESLALLERNEGDAGTAFSTLLAQVYALHQIAEEEGRLGAMELCDILQRVCEHAETGIGDSGSDKFFELAYAFCGAYVDTTGPDDPAMQSWVAECANLIVQWEDQSAIAAATAFASEDEASDGIEEPIVEPVSSPIATVSEAPVMMDEEDEVAPLTDEAPAQMPEIDDSELSDESLPVVPAQDEEEPLAFEYEDTAPEQLLEIATQAILRGETKNAKMYALHAAAGIARLEAAQAETQVHDAELRLRKGAEAIQRGRAAVQQAEEEVVDAEIRVTEGTSELIAQRNVTSGAQSKVEEIQERIRDIDEQIQRLMQRKQEEAAQLSAMQEVYTQAHRREDDAEAAMRQLRDAEQSARIKLENARQNVKALERRRTEIEAAMEKARGLLLERRSAHEEIEQTLSQVRRGRPAQAANPEDLLF